MATTHRVYPHGRLKVIVPNVWLVRGSLPLPVTRNMVVVRLPSGELLLHSMVALDEEGMASVASLGLPAYGIVPHAQHQVDAPYFKRRFPSIKILCTAIDRAKVEPNVEVSGTVEDVLPPLGIALHAVPGIKISEYVYEVPVPSGKVLIANDAFAGANAADESSFLGRVLFKRLGPPKNRFGIARIVRIRLVKDLRAMKHFAGELAATPNLQAVTVSHGEAVVEDAAGALLRVAA